MIPGGIGHGQGDDPTILSPEPHGPTSRGRGGGAGPRGTVPRELVRHEIRATARRRLEVPGAPARQAAAYAAPARPRHRELRARRLDPRLHVRGRRTPAEAAADDQRRGHGAQQRHPRLLKSAAVRRPRHPRVARPVRPRRERLAAHYGTAIIDGKRMQKIGVRTWGDEQEARAERDVVYSDTRIPWGDDAAF